jgi:hypothetical protein
MPRTPAELHRACERWRRIILHVEDSSKGSPFSLPDTRTGYAAKTVKLCRWCLLGFGADGVPPCPEWPRPNEAAEFLTWGMNWCAKRMGTATGAAPEQVAAAAPAPAAGGVAGREEQPGEPATPDNRPRAARARKASVNARMLEAIQANEEAMGWNSRQWAQHLKCAKSSVVETETWDMLRMKRERARAERAQDRRRRSKGRNRQRD